MNIKKMVSLFLLIAFLFASPGGGGRIVSNEEYENALGSILSGFNLPQMSHLERDEFEVFNVGMSVHGIITGANYNNLQERDNALVAMRNYLGHNMALVAVLDRLRQRFIFGHEDE